MTTDVLVERTNYPPLLRKVTLFVSIIRHGIAFEPQLPHRRRKVPRKKEIAVLLTDDGTQINFPKKLLPNGLRDGYILSFEIERDFETTRQVSDQTRAVQLKKTADQLFVVSRRSCCK